MQRRAARQARARRIKIIGTVTAVVVIAGGGGAIAFAMNKPEKKKSATTASASKSPSAQPRVSVNPGECACQPLSDSQNAKDVGKPPVKPVKGTYEMTIDTSQGKIVAKLDGTKASCTVNSFKYLASKK